MRTTFRSVGVLLLVMLVAGCPAPGLRPSGAEPEEPCARSGNSRDCWIDVTVQEAESETGSYCTVQIADEQKDIEFGKKDGVRRIVWRLVEPSDGYKFRSDGIHVKGGPTGRDSDLDLFSWLTNGKRYGVRNRNEREGRYRYEIRVFNEHSGLQCELDPYIRNTR